MDKLWKRLKTLWDDTLWVYYSLFLGIGIFFLVMGMLFAVVKMLPWN